MTCDRMTEEAGEYGRVWIVRLDSFRPSTDCFATLSHECLHAALAIIDHIGARERPPYETLCYLHEAIYRKFLERLCRIYRSDGIELKEQK